MKGGKTNRGCIRTTYKVLLWFGLSLIIGCTEPFNIDNVSLEDFLVVKATITDKMSRQEIILSRTIGFEDDTPIFETGATVVITENGTTEYRFNEIEPGIYVSIQEFGVVADNEYQLSIRTQNGERYISEKVIAPKSSASIENIYAERMTNENGVEGVGIFLNGFDASGSSRYYRYGFEETYQVSAPCWIPLDVTVDVNTAGEYLFELVERPESQISCYKTQFSDNINIVNTSGLAEDRIQDLPINFIPADDISVAERYSILVKQFVQTRDAQSFYSTLSSFSESENIFSQIQPGFIIGNIFLENDPNEKALGFFDVSSVSEERIFFDRDEFLSDLPVFELECQEISSEPTNPEATLEDRFLIIEDFITSNVLRLKVPPFIPPVGEVPTLLFVPRACGDCTALGDAEPPEFWIE